MPVSELNQHIVHLKLTQCYMLIISQKSWKKIFKESEFQCSMCGLYLARRGREGRLQSYKQSK